MPTTTGGGSSGARDNSRSAMVAATAAFFIVLSLIIATSSGGAGISTVTAVEGIISVATRDTACSVNTARSTIYGDAATVNQGVVAYDVVVAAEEEGVSMMTGAFLNHSPPAEEDVDIDNFDENGLDDNLTNAWSGRWNGLLHSAFASPMAWFRDVLFPSSPHLPVVTPLNRSSSSDSTTTTAAAAPTLDTIRGVDFTACGGGDYQVQRGAQWWGGGGGIITCASSSSCL